MSNPGLGEAVDETVRMMSETGLVTGGHRESSGEANTKMVVAATVVAVAATVVAVAFMKAVAVIAIEDAAAEAAAAEAKVVAAMVVSTADAVMSTVAEGVDEGVENPQSLRSSWRTLGKSNLASVMLERPVGTTAVPRANSN